ncbi:Hypothetical predicted protein [Cloeon dipterum]|uniref:Phosphatidylinositol-glycan biosynthesis class X protein n=1 Tax=Cloeon dipterum TaxID=197152 RepID=A0A8S1D0C9_9INSE|nr:Hypothetical predicted protein [Cloeon dipterum]
MNKSAFTWFTLSLLFPLIIAKRNFCHKTATVHRWVSQNGFHRSLQTSIHIPWNLTGCLILLEEKFPSGAFVDPDELARDKKNEVNCVLQHIDVEAFEPKSKPFRVYSYSLPITSGQTEVRITLPFHLRYHEAGPKDKEVVLVQPSLLASCPYLPGEVVQNCPGWSEGPAPCVYCSHELCDWTHLPYSSNELEVSLNVPVGNSDHGGVVMVVTAFTLILATIYLIFTVQKSAKKNR